MSKHAPHKVVNAISHPLRGSTRTKKTISLTLITILILMVVRLIFGLPDLLVWDVTVLIFVVGCIIALVFEVERHETRE